MLRSPWMLFDMVFSAALLAAVCDVDDRAVVDDRIDACRKSETEARDRWLAPAVCGRIVSSSGMLLMYHIEAYRL